MHSQLLFLSFEYLDSSTRFVSNYLANSVYTVHGQNKSVAKALKDNQSFSQTSYEKSKVTIMKEAEDVNDLNIYSYVFE